LLAAVDSEIDILEYGNLDVAEEIGFTKMFCFQRRHTKAPDKI
jgi:hypothetical protein